MDTGFDDFAGLRSDYTLPGEVAAPVDYPWDLPVDEGWHMDVPMEDYLGWPILSASLILLVTQHHERTLSYLRWAMTREREDSGGSNATVLGSLTHTALLEPDLLEEEYVVEPEADPAVYTRADGSRSNNPRNTSTWKTMIAALEATGKTVVTREQYEAAIAMRDLVNKHPLAKGLIELDGPVEASIVVREPTTGLLVKIRPDKLVTAGGFHCNVKTGDNINRDRFMRDAYNFGYYVGAALYERALLAAGFDLRRTFFLAVETAGNKEVAIWEPDIGFMDAGHQVLDKALPLIAECAAKDRWPGYPVDIEFITLPHWAWNRVNDYVIAP